MPHLTELHIGKVDDLAVPGIREALSHLSNLKSLSFFLLPNYVFPSTRLLQHFIRLTRLDTNLMCKDAFIRQLTNLVILRTGIRYQSPLEECPPLNLQLLESLDVYTTSGFKGEMFSELPRLKKLCIQGSNATNGDFFTALARLPQLSSFSLIANFVDEQLPLRYCLQLNLLSGLRSLSISMRSKEPDRLPGPCDFLLEGSFPLLRYLSLKRFTLSPAQKRILMRRFPCLNSLKCV